MEDSDVSIVQEENLSDTKGSPVEDIIDTDVEDITSEEAAEILLTEATEALNDQYNNSKEGIQEALLAMKDIFMDTYNISIKALSRRTKIPKKRLEKLFDKKDYATLEEIIKIKNAFDFYEGYIAHRNRKAAAKTIQQMEEIERNME